MLLQFTVRGQQIFRVDKTPLASDSRLYIAARATFDSEWDDITAIYLNFEPRSGEAINAYLTDGAFDESLGVSLSAGTWRVSAHGSNSAGKEIHTMPLLLNVAQAGGRDGEAPPYVPPDAAGQIAAVAKEAREIAQSVREDADKGLFKGEKGDDGEKGEKGDPGDSTLGITGAKVDEVAQVAEVDGGGKPTKWKSKNISNMESIENRVTALSADSTDTQYPSAKAVYDSLPTLKTWTAEDIATEGETT